MNCCHPISIHAHRTYTLDKQLFENFEVFAFHRKPKKNNHPEFTYVKALSLPSLIINLERCSFEMRSRLLLTMTWVRSIFKGAFLDLNSLVVYSALEAGGNMDT
jgi:hypothetical protein